MKQYKHGTPVPKAKNVEGHLPFDQLEMPIKLLNFLLPRGNKSNKCALTKSEKLLFDKFYQEQQRLTRLAELKYLKAYLLEQRATVNTMAAYIKKRDVKEMKEYGKLPIRYDGSCDNGKTIAPTSEFKVSDDVNDLNAKIKI